eukprot:4331340-Prymnesium_polylepis.1
MVGGPWDPETTKGAHCVKATHTTHPHPGACGCTTGSLNERRSHASCSLVGVKTCRSSLAQRRPSAARAAISAAPKPLLLPSGHSHHGTRCCCSGLHCRAGT